MEDIRHLSGEQWMGPEPLNWERLRERLIESRVKQACPFLCSLEGGQPLRRIQMVALAKLTNVTKHNLVLTTRSICSLTQCNVGDT